jgi:hypothetical protein
MRLRPYGRPVLRLPQSHRARVRLLRRSIVAGVLIVIALLIAFVRNTGKSFDTPEVDRPAMRFHEPKSVPATPEARRAALRTVDAFVRSALVRRNLRASWPLATPHMKVGVKRSEWLAGTLPVAPYTGTFGRAEYGLRYSYRGVLGWGVHLLPKTDRDPEGAYLCELHRVRGSWLVDFCYSEATPTGRYSAVINTGLAP